MLRFARTDLIIRKSVNEIASFEVLFKYSRAKVIRSDNFEKSQSSLTFSLRHEKYFLMFKVNSYLNFFQVEIRQLMIGKSQINKYSAKENPSLVISNA